MASLPQVTRHPIAKPFAGYLLCKNAVVFAFYQKEISTKMGYLQLITKEATELCSG